MLLISSSGRNNSNFPRQNGAYDWPVLEEHCHYNMFKERISRPPYNLSAPWLGQRHHPYPFLTRTQELQGQIPSSLSPSFSYPLWSSHRFYGFDLHPGWVNPPVFLFPLYPIQKPCEPSTAKLRPSVSQVRSFPGKGHCCTQHGLTSKM